MNRAPHPSNRWLLPGAAIVVAQAIASLMIAAWLNIGLVPPIFDYVRESLSFAALFIGCALGLTTFRLLKQRHPRPVFEIGRLAKAQSKRIPVIVFGATLVMVQWSMLTWSKVVLPITVGLWADPYLADLDATIFGGDAWRVFHFTRMDWVEIPYLTWFLVIVASIVWFICQPSSFIRDRAILSYLLCMSSVGMLSIYFLPSGGPIFYERLGFGDRFADLPILHETKSQADYLWRVHTGIQTNVGAGISAMPSMHVALACWLAQHTVRWKVAAWTFFALIFHGSVYLGWHYFIDGLAGAAGAWLCARLVGVWLQLSQISGFSKFELTKFSRGHYES